MEIQHTWNQCRLFLGLAWFMQCQQAVQFASVSMFQYNFVTRLFKSSKAFMNSCASLDTRRKGRQEAGNGYLQGTSHIQPVRANSGLKKQHLCSNPGFVILIQTHFSCRSSGQCNLLPFPQSALTQSAFRAVSSVWGGSKMWHSMLYHSWQDVCMWKFPCIWMHACNQSHESEAWFLLHSCFQLLWSSLVLCANSVASCWRPACSRLCPAFDEYEGVMAKRRRCCHLE